MRPYLALFGARYRLLLQYRAAAWAGVGTQLFWGLIRVMIFTAFYQSTSEPQPLSLEQTISYLWLCQAMLILVLGGIDADVRDAIRSGTVAYELCRPIDLHTAWLARGVAYRTGPLLLRSVPQFIIAGAFFGLQAPPSAAAGAAWLAATLGSILLAAAWSTLITITLLWTIAGDGIARLGLALPWLLSGVTVPLLFLPEWLQAAAAWQPFAGLADFPFRLYIGQLAPSAVGAVLLHQLAWSGLFILAGRALLARGLRRLVVQGG